MAKVKRSTPAPAPAPKPKAPSAKSAKAKSSASAAAAAAADAAAKSPAAVASPPVVIEIPSSPDPSVGVGSKGSSGSKKKARKRPAPPPPLDFDDEIEMWTPRQKQRLDEECEILSEDPLSDTTKVTPSPAAANEEIMVVAERGQVACRDFPHPRSSCAKNPFNTTPHERHCDKCFCYVCDIAAPCVSWKGYGGHCHASDNDKKWKTMRLMMKKAMQVKPI
ncbi:unnamed protein product [Urochloa humidicola]